jgi:hypothetical protein
MSRSIGPLRRTICLLSPAFGTPAQCRLVVGRKGIRRISQGLESHLFEEIGFTDLDSPYGCHIDRIEQLRAWEDGARIA